MSKRQHYYRNRQNRPFLNLERLEDRTVPAYTATLSGTTATFVGNSSGSGDIVVIGRSGGLLIHNRGLIDAGFNSAFDFNSSVAGDQTLAASAGSHINLTTGNGPDEIKIGGQVSSSFQTVAASVLLADFNLTKSGAGNVKVIIDDSISNTGKTFALTSADVTAAGINVSFAGAAFGGGIKLKTGGGNDTVNLTSVLGIGNGVEPRQVFNTGGNDIVTIGSAAGSLDGFAGQPISVIGDAGTTAVTVNDSGDTSNNTYTINATEVRREDGANDVVVLSSGVGVSISLKSGAGNDTINVTPRSDQAISIDGGGGTNSLVIDLAGTTNPIHIPTSATSGNTTYDNREDVDYQNIQNFSGINGTFGTFNPPPSNLVLFIQANVDENDPTGLIGSFTNPDGEAHTVTIDFADGSVPVVLNLAAGESGFQVDHTYLDDDPSGTGADVKTITVTVSDGVNSISNTRNTLVHNVAPSNVSITTVPATVGSATTIQVTFTDPGTLDAHLLNVDFGDGITQNIGFGPGQTSVSFNHTYASAGSFTVSVVVNDDDLGSSPQAQATVNVAVPVPVVTPATDQFANEGTAKAFTLGSIADGNSSGNYLVTVNWGDGTANTVFNQASTGTMTPQSHTYAQDGSFTVTITAEDADGASTPVTFSVNVGNVAPNRTPPVSQSAFSGISQSFALGSFTDPGADASWNIVVNWGDGTPNTTFQLNAPGAIPAKNHTYASPGNFTLSVSISDDDVTTATTSQVSVANSVAVVTPPANQNGSEGTSKSFSLGSFTDANNSGNYTVTVNWGDGTANTVFNQATVGAITGQNHTYAQDDSFPVTISVSDVDGSSSPVGFQVNVSNVLPVAIDAPDQNGVATIAKSFALGSFTDPGAEAPWHITVNWGDGSPNGSFTVNTPGELPAITHAFANAGNFTVAVTVQDDDGSATSDYLVHVIPPIAHVTGNVFRDFNNNGQVNAVDVGLAGVTVFADRNGDGELDANEPFTTTGADGDYQLDVGFEGAVTVRQVIPDGFKQTTANPADVNVQFSDTVSVDSLGDNRIITPTIAVAGRLKSLPFVQVRNPDGTLRFSFTPFTKPATLKEVRLATGDVNDDGIEDVFVVPGPGASSLVKVFDGADGHLISSFTAFATTFTGGASIAAGDVNGDGVADIVVGTEKGAGPLVKIFDGANNQLIRSFIPTNASLYTGVKVAVGDVNGDGVVDVITSPGTSTEHSQYRIRAQDALTGTSLLSFLVNPVNYCIATLNVTAGDLDHDGRAEIILATTRIGQTQVQTFKNGFIKEVGLPLAANFRSTAFSVTAKDLTGDGIADLLFAGSQGQSPRLKLVNGATGQTLFSALLLGDKDRNGLIVG